MEGKRGMLLLLYQALLFMMSSFARAEGEEIRTRIPAGEMQWVATREDNAATRALPGQVPMTLPMRERDERELCCRPGEDALPTEDLRSDGYDVGGIACLLSTDELVICCGTNGGELERRHLGRTDADAELFAEPGDVDLTFDVLQETEEADSMRMQVTDGTHAILFELNDSSAAKSLFARLPLTIAVENYSDDEKIFYPEELDTSKPVDAHAGKGTPAYFSPRGDVVMYYRDFGSYPGLYEPGQAVSGR